jgi:hypothetical protein
MSESDNKRVYDRILRRLQRIANPDMVPLMIAWVDIIRTDNREGVLAGLDKDGRPMLPVTYRPDPKAGTQIDIRSRQAANLRRGMHAARKHDLLFGGIGLHLSGINNNLSSVEYRRSTGPPLAPRYQFSRVITNLLIGYFEEGQGRASVWGYWDEVVNVKGEKFLHYHFNGLTLRNGRQLPPRDLRGVRPDGKKKCLEAFRAWALDLLRATGV